ncbi:MAG: hypothetical protein QN174_11935 [Armatimonadota bacterium]|nr:hypothetical protein [Armatimonadota bacterium]MDR7421329.1 hypothetical protein [Armatimonadota bacterium]MDR7454922.1 hypothetical protein [Armatimonadota bacterium]MDR7457766.1 hypothetical protein [Armatimonadota bacterium]MDR7497653.1 hypothetical protein [Armatimonadota bacterium]
MATGAALALILLLAVPAMAQGPELALVEVGFAGFARPGAWTPVWVDVTAAGRDLDATVVVEAPSPLGQPVVRFATPVRAAAGARVRVFVPATFLDARTPGTVALEDRGRRLAAVAVPRLRPVEQLALVLSDEPLSLEAAAARADGLEVAYLQAERLPPVWQAYETVRVLVVRTFDDRRVDDRQRIAIREWLQAGGRVVLMPAGDDLRHLRGPTFAPLRAAAATGLGRGRLIVWTDDAAHPALRASPALDRGWDAVLAAAPVPATPVLEATLPAGRPVPLPVYAAIGALVALYVVAVRWTSRRLAALRWPAVAVWLVLVAAATVGAGQVAVRARAEASGVVSAAVVEAIPGSGHGLLWVAGRTISSHGGAFAVSLAPGVLVRPTPPASLDVVWADGVTLVGRGAAVGFFGSGLVPAPITGTVTARGDAIQVANASGRVLERAWVFRAGRVHALPPVGERLELSLDETRWQPHERLQRAEGHALLTWAFSRLDGDAILKATPAWLVGWWRDPSLALRWDGRLQTPQQLVLVPLATRP